MIYQTAWGIYVEQTWGREALTSRRQFVKESTFLYIFSLEFDSIASCLYMTYLYLYYNLSAGSHAKCDMCHYASTSIRTFWQHVRSACVSLDL